MHRDFVDLLRALSGAEARFLVVGAFAVGRSGRPRATGDLDLWIDRAPENARRVYSAVCLRTLPMVFDVRRRRWIAPHGSEWNA